MDSPQVPAEDEFPEVIAFENVHKGDDGMIRAQHMTSGEEISASSPNSLQNAACVARTAETYRRASR